MGKGSIRPLRIVGSYILIIISFFVSFVALRAKSTAMVMAGRSAHLITLFPGQA